MLGVLESIASCTYVHISGRIGLIVFGLFVYGTAYLEISKTCLVIVYAKELWVTAHQREAERMGMAARVPERSRSDAANTWRGQKHARLAARLVSFGSPVYHDTTSC
jgi:hypothetical protein